MRCSTNIPLCKPLLALLCLVLGAVGPGAAQDTTRAERLVAMRRAKAASLQPPKPSLVERVVRFVKERNFIEDNKLVIDLPSVDLLGIQPWLGGLGSGSGRAVGLRYRRGGERYDFIQIEGGVSQRRYVELEGVLGYEWGERERLVTYAYARYRHQPQEDFYGIGPGTRRAARADYGLDETIAGALVGTSPLYRTLVGGHASVLLNRLGPGRDPQYPDVRDAFEATSVPGLSEGTSYLVLGGWAEYDGRDTPYVEGHGRRFAPTQEWLRGISLDASRGLYLAAVATYHFQVGGARYRFARLDLEAQQYLPLRRGMQTIALREYASFTATGAGADVPFYLMQPLGGGRSLRGFSSFRFRDRHAALVNMEFRWQVWLRLDLALFLDAGYVFDELADLRPGRLEKGYGLSLRFRSRSGRRVIYRLDLARSREGTSVGINLGSVL